MDRSHFTLLFALALSTIVGGCASSRNAQLTLRPAEGRVAYAQKFTQAYAGRTPDGSWSFVLLADDDQPAANNDAKRLEPSSQMPLRQVVHVKVLWQPMSGTGRETSVSNAAIDWYVLSPTAAGGDDLLLYQGCGHVTLDPGDHATKVTIRSGNLKPSVTHGKLADPLGAAKLSGKFVALNDNAKLQHVLSDTRARTASIASSH